jgi:hypothetical protein
MLLDIAECSKPPKMRQFVVVSSVVWLKRIDDGDSGIGHTDDCPADHSPAIMVPAMGDREASFNRWDLPVLNNQLPREIIQAGTEVVHEVTKGQHGRDSICEFGMCEQNRIFAGISIFFDTDFVRVTVGKMLYLQLESLQVFTSPLSLEVWFEKAWDCEGHD